MKKTEKDLEEASLIETKNTMRKHIYTYYLPIILFKILNNTLPNNRERVKEELFQMFQPRWQNEYLIKEDLLNEIVNTLYKE
jgi:hypothetical protein